MKATRVIRVVNCWCFRFDSRGIFIYEDESVMMKKWQILEFDGKPYYAFVPDSHVPINDNDIPEIEEDHHSVNDKKQNICLVESNIPTEQSDRQDFEEEYCSNEESEAVDVKPVLTRSDFIEKSTCETKSEESYSVAIPKHSKLEPISEGIVYPQKMEVPDESEYREAECEEKSEGFAETIEEIQYYEEAEIERGENLENIENVEYLDTEYLDSGGVEDHAADDIEYDEDAEEMLEFEDLDEESSSHRVPLTPTMEKATLKCTACSETFSSRMAFRKHVAWTHKKKVCIRENNAYICSVCDYRTLKKTQFAAHLARKHETWSKKRQSSMAFPCAACGFVCRSRHSLQSHFIRKHTDRYEYECKTCLKKFKVKGDLTNHIRFHHKETPVNCEICNKLCQNSGSLYVHQKWAHFKPKFECPICKRRMVTQENLDQHMISQHEKREKIVCAECGRTFNKKDSFKRHMAVHTGNKPHVCIICNKAFARRSQLRQHLLIHTGKRPFVCDICGKAFTQKPGLICHRKTHPGDHPPLPVMPIGDIVKEFTDGYQEPMQNDSNQE